MEIKAIVFDVDGTLYPNSSMYYHSLPYFIKNYSIIKKFMKVRSKVRKIKPIDDFISLQNRELASIFGTTEEKAGSIIDNTVFIDWYKRLQKVKVYKGIKEFLNEIKNDYKLALLSDFPVDDKKIKIFDIDGYWEYKMWSAESNYLKPNREPFDFIANKINIKNENILYVGDSYKYDVVGAKNAGMYVAHITRFPKKNSIADISFFDYQDLLAWLKKENKKTIYY